MKITKYLITKIWSHTVVNPPMLFLLDDNVPTFSIAKALYIQYSYCVGAYNQYKQFKQQLKEYCCSPELRHGKKYTYLRNYPPSSLIPLYHTDHDVRHGIYIATVIITPLHLGYVKGEGCSSKEEAEEIAAKRMLQELQQC